MSQTMTTLVLLHGAIVPLPVAVKLFKLEASAASQAVSNGEDSEVSYACL